MVHINVVQVQQDELFTAYTYFGKEYCDCSFGHVLGSVYQLCHGWDANQLAGVVRTFMLLDVFEVPLPELRDGVDFKDV